MTRAWHPRHLVIVAAWLGAMSPAAGRGEVVPFAESGDPHIQFVNYSALEVVALSVQTGYVLTVAFGPEERVEAIVVGDSSSWQVQATGKANHIIVKPNGWVPDTNMTVLTNQHTYNFVLSTQSRGQTVQPYLVNFIYPVAPNAPSSVRAEQGPAQYSMKGDRRIWPSEISDDGITMTLRWPETVDIPAVYAEDDGSQLTLVNGSWRGEELVIDSIYRRLVFVRGRLKATAERRVIGQ